MTFICWQQRLVKILHQRNMLTNLTILLSSY